jgi:hypothetical protein
MCDTSHMCCLGYVCAQELLNHPVPHLTSDISLEVMISFLSISLTNVIIKRFLKISYTLEMMREYFNIYFKDTSVPCIYFCFYFYSFYLQHPLLHHNCLMT